MNPTPEQIAKDNLPEIDGLSYSSYGALMADLMSGSIPVPCWIRVGRVRHRITSENKDGVQKGLLIAVDFVFQNDG